MLIDETLVSEFCASIKSINIHKSIDAYPSIYALDVREDTEGPVVFILCNNNNTGLRVVASRFLFIQQQYNNPAPPPV